MHMPASKITKIIINLVGDGLISGYLLHISGLVHVRMLKNSSYVQLSYTNIFF